MKIYNVTHVIMNYGSVLQAYALQKKLQELGADTQIVRVLNDNAKKGKKGFARKILYKARGLVRLLKPEKHYSTFRKVSLALTKHRFSEKYKKINQFIESKINTLDVGKLNEIAKYIDPNDKLVVGSDQVWSMVKGDIRPLFTLEWPELPDGIRKYSYAASIGMNELTEAQKIRFGSFLKSFQVVSFREAQAMELLRPVIKCPVRCDIDPTLLYDGDTWAKIAAHRIVQKPYIFVYMLRPDKRLINMAREYAHRKGYRVYYSGLMANKFHGVETVCDAGVEDFLSYIRYSEGVITNSFHGTVFSILFKKKFVSVKIGTTSSRVENILSNLGLEGRYIEDENELDVLEEAIDYRRPLSMLNEARQKSISYLQWICEE